ncbi:MAG: hypothetical protein SGARI_000266 [Bacillariaceae sp.]
MQLSGKSNQIKFRSDPRIVRLALGNWLRSPCATEQLKKNSIEILPSERTLYRYQKELISHEGYCPKVYSWMRDERSHKPNYHPLCILKCDELTFQTNIYTNIKNNCVQAFASTDGCDSIDLSKEIVALLQENGEDTDSDKLQSAEKPKEKPKCEVAKKVNFFEQETEFNALCARINGYMLKRLACMSEVKEPRGLHVVVFHLLQNDGLTKLLDKMISSKELRDRIGWGVILLGLERRLINQMKSCLHKAETSTPTKDSASACMVRLNVNRFVGFALNRLIEHGKNNCFENPEDDKERMLLDAYCKMRVFHSRVLFNDHYMKEWYDTAFAMKNNGYLALVSPDFLPFGELLMKVIMDVFELVTYDNYGDETISEVSIRLQGRIGELKLCLSNCFQKVGEDLQDSDIDFATRLLLDKTRNAYLGAVTKWFRETRTGKGGKDYTAGTFRGHLKSTSVKGGQVNKRKIKDAEESKVKSKKSK